MAIAAGHRANFKTLIKAIQAGDVALMECQLAATGENVAVVCAAVEVSSGNTQFFPFALLFNDNPYKLVNPPKPEGGFHSQEEVWQ